MTYTPITDTDVVEMLKIIKETLEKYNVLSCIDVGTSSYEKNESSNYIISRISGPEDSQNDPWNLLRM